MSAAMSTEPEMSVSAPSGRTIVCYAEGEADRWEAYCLTFDLAVRGHAFDEVRRKLAEQVELYLEGVAAAPPGERRRLLRRRAPLLAWLRPLWKLAAVSFGRRDAKERYEFTLPLGRQPAA